MKQRTPVLAVLALAVVACAPNAALHQAQGQAEAGDLEGARVALEREQERRPESADVRVALGEVYYRIARDHLDRSQDETAYLTFLERSVSEFVAALEIDPRDSRPHFYLAVMDTYRGQITQALRGFQNTRRLSDSGIACTNIAEIYVYMGHPNKARYWNTQGQRKGVPRSAVIFNEMLLAWKEGDLDGAEWRFHRLEKSYPEMIRTINVARLPSTPRDFEEFAGYCCRSPACGPYMLDACRGLGLEVHDRDVSKETVLQELRIEMEKQRRLNEVYRQRKDLEIELEPPPAP